MSVDEILEAMEAVIAAARNPDGTERDLTDDEARAYTDLERQLASARRSLELRQRQVAYTTPTGRALVTTGGGGADPRADVLARAFDAYVRTGTVSAELAEQRAQYEGSPTAGGYLVPDGFRDKLTEKIVEYGNFAAEAETLNTSSGNPLVWPTIDDSANLGEIVAENETFAAGADLVFGQETLGAYKYMAGGGGNLPLKVSFELLQDSAFDVESLLTRLLGARIGRIQATHWIRGDGTGEPEGILTPKTAYGAIASNAAGPTYGNLVATVHALDPGYRGNAKWLMNDATAAVLQNIVDGNERPLWADASAGLSGAMPQSTLLGYPVIIDQAVPSIGDNTKFLAFGDFRQAYVIRRVQDVTLVALRERYAEFGQVGFFAWARADGAVQDHNAYVVLGAENTA